MPTGQLMRMRYGGMDIIVVPSAMRSRRNTSSVPASTAGMRAIVGKTVPSH